ncbi:MAG: hypothetical protein V7736_17605 [Colwellia polaris]|jgi:hypothetical protein|uniref:hypothetical protein n=1 Tax=Colwellia polaris TaxID=326537 RepID=UPI000A17693A|nr:hypothetical protein [Colwellia polaris]|tara:strand:+ start:8504 stop:8827 length:324 start_codon:yes stop_codon:yes gene_type:complete
MAKNIITKTLKAIYQYKMALLFVVLWAHVSLLNLFFVNYSGPVFLWEQNAQLITIQTHFLIALITTLFFLMVSKCREFNRNKKVKISDKIWLLCSILLIASITFVLI